jgi:hypothetical protein
MLKLLVPHGHDSQTVSELARIAESYLAITIGSSIRSPEPETDGRPGQSSKPAFTASSRNILTVSSE